MLYRAGEGTVSDTVVVESVGSPVLEIVGLEELAGKLSPRFSRCPDFPALRQRPEIAFPPLAFASHHSHETKSFSRGHRVNGERVMLSTVTYARLSQMTKVVC